MNLLETARKILNQGPICDHCLGRQFAKLSTCLTNDKRGSAVKLTLAMIGDLEKKENGDESLLKELARCSAYARYSLGLNGEDEKCWVCNGLFLELGKWADLAIEALAGYEYNTFLVGTKITGLLSENEEILWAESGITQAEPLKTELNREVGKILEAGTGKKADLARPDIAILLDLEKEKVELQVNSLYIYGCYRKLVRGIPQTRWPCRECGGTGCSYCDYTGKMYRESVDELIRGPVIEATLGSDTAFHGAGREDIDALMLGEGRPFIVEAKSPKRRFLDLARLEKNINTSAGGKIEVSGLSFVEGGMVERLKAVRLDKVYRIKVQFKDPIPEERLKSSLNILGGATIKQRTPSRVLHRRGDLERIRRLRSLEIEEFEGNKATLIVGTEGGLYVKELITGDGGRTQPSLSEVLGIETKVIELEVIKIILEGSVCRNPMVSGENRATK